MSRRTSRLFLLAIFLLVLAVIVAAFVPPPRAVVRFLAVQSAPWLMTGSDASDGRIVGATKRLWRGYIQNALAAHFANEVIVDERDDLQTLNDIIAASRKLVLAPREADELRYDPAQMPAIVAGVGYCDQINAVVASTASHHFEKAELFALYERGRMAAPHSVGRVWSKDRNQWLYYDAFYARPVIFTKDAYGRAHYLQATPKPSLKCRPPAPRGVYDLPGWTLSEFPPSFAMYVLARSGKTAEPTFVASAAPEPAKPTTSTSTHASTTTTTHASGGVLDAPPVLAADLSAPAETPRHLQQRSDPVYRRVARAYVSARLAHLMHSPDLGAYRAIASDPTAARDDRAAEMAAAATRFARQLQQPRR